MSALTAATTGCIERDASVSETPAEPALIVGDQYRYEPDDRWTRLDAGRQDDPLAEEIGVLLETSVPVSVVHLGDRVRLYSVGGHWRHMTLTVLDETKTPIETIRLDMPPSGVIRGPLPDPGGNGTISLKFTQPSFTADDFELVDRSEATPAIQKQIGIPSEEFTTESVKDMGFASIRRSTASDGEMKITSEKWAAAIKSDTATLTTDNWKSIVLAERYSSFASHSGNSGQPPPETWWAHTVAEVVQGIKAQEDAP